VILTEWVSVNCIVRDLSPGGARLEFEAPVYLPREFRLCIVSADLTIPAVPAWQRQSEAGVRFTGVGVAGRVDSTPKRVPTAA
ncbi:MAG: PilZ domain-containing protein, partial [Propylenella sp.]